MPTKTDRKFPCPVCTHPLEVRLTKKNKPYVTCDPCGVQLFIRGPEGIEGFKRLIQKGNSTGLLDRLEEMERHYRLACPNAAADFGSSRTWSRRAVLTGA